MSWNDRCYVIAEAGVNHNGDIGRALALIDIAADAGAEAVKFQTFVPQALASRHAENAEYQKRQGDSEGQLAMLERLALPFETFRHLQAHCRQRGIDFLSSPFDPASADFLIDELGLDTIKLGSGELTNGPLLWRIARKGVKLILSTGMATLEEVENTLGLLCLAYSGRSPENHGADFRSEFRKGILDGHVSLLHCTSEYPCPYGEVDLRSMDTLADRFGLTVGYSDHTLGISVALAAAARGAGIVEKHFTQSRELSGPDHAASLEPAELAEMIRGIRQIEQALGSAEKPVHESERKVAKVARKSLVTTRPVRKGERLDTTTVTVKRPGTGLSPMHYWQSIGASANRDYGTDEPLDPALVDH